MKTKLLKKIRRWKIVVYSPGSDPERKIFQGVKDGKSIRYCKVDSIGEISLLLNRILYYEFYRMSNYGAFASDSWDKGSYHYLRTMRQ